jgi:hypothetical protein
VKYGWTDHGKILVKTDDNTDSIIINNVSKATKMAITDLDTDVSFQRIEVFQNTDTDNFTHDMIIKKI